MKKEKLLIIAVLVGVVLTHSSFIKNGFTWLDHGDIEAGRAVLPIAKLPRAFFTRFGETGFYRPLVTILNSIDAFFYGKSPQGYHFTNVLLHVAVSLAAFFFALTFFELSYIESSIVALVVGVHPLSILPVGAISYRQELLVVMFTFAAVSAHIRARGTGKFIWIAGSIFFWAAALLSKETALFWVPALIFFWEWIKGFKKLDQDLWYFACLLFTAIFYIVLRLRAVPELWSAHVENLSFDQALGTRLLILIRRFIDIFNPIKPNLSDATLIVDMTSWRPLLTIFIVLACATMIYIRKKKSITSRILFFIFITLLPSLSIIPLPRFNSPHYSFVAAPAAGVAVILIGKQIVNSFGLLGKAVFSLFAILWISLMAVNTFSAGFLFKNDLILFGPEVARDENYREGHFYLGDYYLRSRKLEEAIKHFEDSLIKKPKIIAFIDRPAAKINLAGAYFSQQKIEKAEKLLREVANESSGTNRLNALYNLAVIADRNGDYQEVVKLLRVEINRWQWPEPLLLFVKGLVKTGREVEAESILKNRLFIDEYKERQEIIQTFR